MRDKDNSVLASCINFNKLVIKVDEVHGRCSYGMKTGQKYRLPDIVPDGWCLAALHSILPYFLTFIHEGQFGWLSDRNAVIAQCPNPVNTVVMNLKKIEDVDKTAVKIQESGVCPEGLMIHDVCNLQKLPFCPKALHAVFPYIMKMNSISKSEQNGDNVCSVASCPGYPDYTVFKIWFE